MKSHYNKEADKLWDKVISPFLQTYVFPHHFNETFISQNEALKYGILGRVARNDGYTLCVEDVFASFVIFSPQQFGQIKLSRSIFLRVACDLVEEVKRCAQWSFFNSALRRQKDISSKYNEQEVNSLFSDYTNAFKRYFSLFNEEPKVTTLKVFFPSENGYVERERREFTFDICLSSEYEALDGVFLLGYDYGVVTSKGERWVSDVVAKDGKNYFATDLQSVDGYSEKLHIWRF